MIAIDPPVRFPFFLFYPRAVHARNNVLLKIVGREALVSRACQPCRTCYPPAGEAVSREGLEVADVFRHFGPAFRDQHGASLSTARRRAMIAIETCRTAALGGHVERCGDCGHQRVAFTYAAIATVLSAKVWRGRNGSKTVRQNCSTWPTFIWCSRCRT